MYLTFGKWSICHLTLENLHLCVTVWAQMTDRSQQQGVPGLCWVGMYLQKSSWAEPGVACCCLGWLAGKLTKLKCIDGADASAMTALTVHEFCSSWGFQWRNCSHIVSLGVPKCFCLDLKLFLAFCLWQPVFWGHLLFSNEKAQVQPGIFKNSKIK